MVTAMSKTGSFHSESRIEGILWLQYLEIYYQIDEQGNAVRVLQHRLSAFNELLRLVEPRA